MLLASKNYKTDQNNYLRKIQRVITNLVVKKIDVI